LLDEDPSVPHDGTVPQKGDLDGDNWGPMMQRDATRWAHQLKAESSTSLFIGAGTSVGRAAVKAGLN